MPELGYTNAIKEAYASAKKNVAIIDSLEISHPELTTFYLVRNKSALTLTNENSETNVFEPVSFMLDRPRQGETGAQELTLTVDNVDRRISDSIETVKNSQTPVTVKWRPYLSSDLTAPQMAAPLELTLADVTVDNFNVVGRCQFVNVINRPFVNELFTRSRFPSLGE
jgi:hypothetical protein